MILRRPLRFGLPLLLAFAALWTGAGRVRAEESPVGRIIADIIPVDNKVRSTGHILAKMNLKKGKAYDEQMATEDVARLSGTGWFAANGVELKTAIGSDGLVIVFVKVRELQNTVKEILFLGNDHYSFDNLFELTRVRRGSPLNPALNRQAAAAITQKLREDGRYYGTCTVIEGDNPSDERVVFNIVEGPVVRIGKVGFRGNKVASDGRLHTVVNARGAALGFATVLTPKFQSAILEVDRKQLLFYYHKLGYLDARIEPEVQPLASDLSTVQIVYHIVEGATYSVRSVVIDGNKAFTEDRLKKVTALKIGERYDESVVQADMNRITTLYGNGGHRVMVEPGVFQVQGKDDQVDVHYRVLEPGSKGPDRVGSIKIEGNTITQERVIRNQLNFFSGQVLEYPKLKQAEANLARLGIFDAEDPPVIDVEQSNFDSSYKDIRVRVKETRTGQVGLQVGVNSNAGLNGTLSINQRNFDITRFPTSFDDLLGGKAFRGAGQELRIQATPGTQFQRYELTWRDPYFLDTRFGLTESFYVADRAYNEYNENRYGVRSTVDYRFDDSPIWRASGSARVEGVGVNHVPSFASDRIARDAGRHFQVGLRAGLNRDTRDSYLMPSSGSVFDVGFEQILGDKTFPIGTAELTKFWTVHQARDGGWRGVLAARSQLSVTTEDAPVYERFFAGGFRSLRGFQFRGVGPHENTLNTGGSFAFLNTIEYQIPLVANERLRFVTFVDHGTVDRNVSLDNYRVSVGVGIRLQVPAFGPLPIALDFGFPVIKGPDDQKQVFSFYVGWIGGQ